ncbi:MAG: phosphotransferase [Mycobacteriales bacterium]
MVEDRLRAIAAALDLSIERRLAGGLWGAYLGRTSGGARVVIKPLVVHPSHTLERAQGAVALAMRLRDDGYPVPRYLDVTAVGGQVVTVQEYVDGLVPDVFEPDHARQLIVLWQMHEGRAVRIAHAPVDPLSDVRDPDGPDSQALRESGDAYIREVYEEARAVVDSTDVALFRGYDVVHHDFHHRNFLVRGDRIVAVFDWEGAGPGDSRADLCELAWSSPSPDRTRDADAVARAAFDATVEPVVAAAMAASRAIEKLAFGLRSDPATLHGVLGSVRMHLRPRWHALGR